MLQSGGQNQKWPTRGQSGYITLAVSGVRNASERGTRSQVAHNWAKSLRNPCRAGDNIRSGPQVGLLATQPLPSGGVPNASERGKKSKVAHKWAWWLHNPCHLEGPQRFTTGDNIKSGPQVGRVATSPLPPGWSPTL